MNRNGLGPMNDGKGWCSNPEYTGFGGRGRAAHGCGRGRGRGLAGAGSGRGFGAAMGRGMGPGRGMGFRNGAPGYGNRAAVQGRPGGLYRAGEAGEGWTKPAGARGDC